MQTDSSALSLMDLFVMGGAFMWPLLLFSIVALGIGLERVVYLMRHNLRLDDLRAAVLTGIQEGAIAGAREYLAANTGNRIGARVLLTLVERAGLSEHQMERAVETEALACVNELESGFNFLSALVSIAPLTGFLGTVSGMIGAFRSIAAATDVNAQIVANGIFEALITTAFGLSIAIVAMVAHSILVHIVDQFTAETEKVCSELITEIVARQTPLAPQPVPAARAVSPVLLPDKTSAAYKNIADGI
jgi:biopolymer transport protein ExbB